MWYKNEGGITRKRQGRYDDKRGEQSYKITINRLEQWLHDHKNSTRTRAIHRVEQPNDKGGINMTDKGENKIEDRGTEGSHLGKWGENKSTSSTARTR